MRERITAPAALGILAVLVGIIGLLVFLSNNGSLPVGPSLNTVSVNSIDVSEGGTVQATNIDELNFAVNATVVANGSAADISVGVQPTATPQPTPTLVPTATPQPTPTVDSTIFEWVIVYSQSDPTDAEDDTIGFLESGIVTSERCVLVGSDSPSVTITLRFDSDRSDTGDELNTGGNTITSTTTGDTDTSFDDASWSDGYLWIETTATSGTVDEINCTWMGEFS